MAKFISNDLNMYIYSATGTPVDYTTPNVDSITAASPSVISLIGIDPGTPAGGTDGDIITFADTKVDELNEGMFVLSSTGVGSTTALGSDIDAGEAAAFDKTTATAKIYVAADFVKICLSELDIGETTTTDLDAGTFCGAATLPGPEELGSVTLSGWVDTSAATYTTLKGLLEAGGEHIIKIEGPDSQYWVGKLKFGALSWTFTRGEIVGFSLTATQALKINHVF